MDKTDNYYKAMSDIAILGLMGSFIKHHRLKQNKTQIQLATDAGINRSTLVDFEQGKRSNTLTLIQLLRALNLMHVFEGFQIQYQQSPLQLAKLQAQERKRAYVSKNKKQKPLSDW